MKYTLLKIIVETHTKDGICAYALPDGEPRAGVNGKFSELSKKRLVQLFVIIPEFFRAGGSVIRQRLFCYFFCLKKVEKKRTDIVKRVVNNTS